jgi:hypothetical protein
VGVFFFTVQFETEHDNKWLQFINNVVIKGVLYSSASMKVTVTAPDSLEARQYDTQESSFLGDSSFLLQFHFVL